jgi:hypothetical protein
MGHWYDKTGAPKHHEGKGGKDTTLREARKLNLYPSVTTVGQVVAKFALTNWLQEEAALVAGNEAFADGYGIYPDAMLVRDLGDTKDRKWARKMVAKAKEKTMAKADAGTDIHDLLERYQKHDVVKTVDVPMCAAVHGLIEEKTGLDFIEDFEAEMRFCDTKHGYAGMCDLSGEEWIIDYKSKDTVSPKTRGFPEQAEQLAAYAHGLGYPNARLANVFISREDPSQVVWFEHKDPMAWERFRHTLML